MRLSHYAPVLSAIVLASGTVATCGHIPLKRVQDQNDLFYLSPRVYVPSLEYLFPQRLHTNDEAGYGVYASVLLPITPLSRNLYAMVDADVLLNAADASYVATQFEYGARYRFPWDFSVGVKSSKHRGHPQSLEAVPWNALLLGYDFSFPCRPARIDHTLEFYYFPPHNEFDPNPGIPFEDRVVARYALDYTVALENIYDSPIYLAGRFFFPLGDSRPQISYNHRAEPIACFLRVRCGYRVNKAFSFYAEYGDGIDLGGMRSSRELGETLSFGGVLAF